VICTGFRNPALLAKMADTVEEISNGRLILGIGTGWNEAEHHAFGYPFDHRFSRFKEALTIITGLLRRGHVNFEGTYYQARDCELRPRGPRPGGPPLLIGSSSPRMLELLARHGDMWNTWFTSTGNSAAGLQSLMEAVNAACAAVGRDPVTLRRTATVLVSIGNGRMSTETVAPLTGTPEEIAAG
jgi:alkanesulfonate monooxygenase SsuD/methylene tetrahydromethanopterin reductase-like flavin-dependent oxidoreductase (luciferase family)